MTNLIITKSEPGLLLLTLNRAEKRNALNTPLLSELARKFREAQVADEIRCVVLAGNDHVFSAGADIKEMLDLGPGALRNPERTASWYVLSRFEKPLIAAVNGFALGGGNELAMLADIIVAGSTARFGQPEVTLGGIPGDGGTQRLVRLVGKAMAMRMILTGQPIDAETALRCGLVAEVTSPQDTVERALSIGRTIAQSPAVATRLAKMAVLQAYETTLNAGLSFERQISHLISSSEDRQQRLEAFLRRPSMK